MKTEFNTRGSQRKREAPFSLRLTFEERAKLEDAANGVPLGTYIKAVLFGSGLPAPRRDRGGRAERRP
ncbi:hypothetical protein [Roseovarius sp. MBR-6]|jgi:hypothetical protein|uniref:hypothetical protein n=1 Tax=Roseovarius sp. MBR-6 TaxID=3156459 RepID=UPI003392D778